MMDNWVPNPHAKPYIPRHHAAASSGKVYGSAFRQFTVGKWKFISKIFQAALVLVLLVTVIINVMFIMETSNKLQKESHNIDLQNPQNQQDNVVKVMSQPRAISLEVVSSKDTVSVIVDGTKVLHDDKFDSNRGIHIVILNQATGSVMAKRLFDTYNRNEDDELILFFNMVSDGRIIIIAVKDEGTLSLRTNARQLLKRLGSEVIETLSWRDTWAFICTKAGGKVSEGHGKSADMKSWGEPVDLRTEITLVKIEESECHWISNDVTHRRRAFCNKVEGYGSVCSCNDPAPITFNNEPIVPNHVANVPVVVIASNRPHYLYRMLRSLLTTPGVNPKLVTVFIDGYFEEPLEVAKLFGLEGIQHTPIGLKNARISQHYKASLTATFNLHTEAKYTIILEEDLDISPDFFNYFSQLVPLIEKDESIYCISAWNDQGYDHSCKDERLLYRVETMPGLGWLLKKKLYKEELEPNWPSPEKQWDWDMWMRSGGIRKDRECIIPDISRTYHFGSKGLNMNPYFQDLYFKKHSLMTLPSVQLKDVEKMKASEYEEVVKTLIQSAILLDHSKSPCAEDFVPSTEGKTYIMYISMNTSTEYTTWRQIAKCCHLWDLDVRGFHKSMWRFFLNNNHVITVGHPVSAYAVFKPKNIQPIYIPAPSPPPNKKAGS